MKITINDIKSFIDGNWRYILYCFIPSFLTNYVKQKFEWRLKRAKPCLLNGECLYCGCKTPELFMADKKCSDPMRKCYPALIPLSKRIEIMLRWKLRKITRKIGLML